MARGSDCDIGCGFGVGVSCVLVAARGILVAVEVLRCLFGVGDYPWEPFGRHPMVGLWRWACDMHCFQDVVPNQILGCVRDIGNEFAS